jgi:hypothetical protein
MLVADHVMELVDRSTPGPHDRAVLLYSAGMAYGEGGRVDRGCALVREASDLAGAAWTQGLTTQTRVWLADHCR